VALLRVLQGETDGAFDGNLSWIPYLICTVVVWPGCGGRPGHPAGQARRQDQPNKEAA